MTERMERRRVARIALSGTPTVRTHDGVAARLLDLSLYGARLAHGGILRPGSHCLVQLPAELGSLRLPAQILWCTILGAAAGPDGERSLHSQTGLWFPTLTESQGTVLAGILQQALTGEPPRREREPQAAYPASDFPRLMRGWAAARLPGKTGREASEPFAGMVGIRRASSSA